MVACHRCSKPASIGDAKNRGWCESCAGIALSSIKTASNDGGCPKCGQPVNAVAGFVHDADGRMFHFTRSHSDCVAVSLGNMD
jgi:hypothetical protein